MSPADGTPGKPGPRRPRGRGRPKAAAPARPTRPSASRRAPRSAIRDAAAAAARRAAAELQLSEERERLKAKEQARAEREAQRADELEEQRQEDEAATWEEPPVASDAAGNGHSDWVDYEGETTAWDPWDDGDGSAEGRGLNRTLGEWLEAVVPPEAQLHFFNAGREFAAGLQTTLDHHLHRGGEDDDGGAEALRIEIE